MFCIFFGVNSPFTYLFFILFIILIWSFPLHLILFLSCPLIILQLDLFNSSIFHFYCSSTRLCLDETCNWVMRARWGKWMSSNNNNSTSGYSVSTCQQAQEQEERLQKTTTTKMLFKEYVYHVNRSALTTLNQLRFHSI